MEVNIAEVQTMDVTVDVTVNVSMDTTMGVDMKALEYHWSS